MEKHLCIVIERHSKKQLAEYIIKAHDWHCARHIAAARFEDENPKYPVDWCVDSLKLDELDD
jgi:hypothetical protein